MPAIIQVVGFQNSGKTTFVERLVHACKESHIAVGVIKHHGHADDLNLHKDKDTGILFHAGADLVIGNSRINSEILMHHDLGLDGAIAFMQLQGMEQIIIEGYKNQPYPKIILLSKKADLILLSQLENIIGVYCTHGFDLPETYACPNLTVDAWCKKIASHLLGKSV